MTVTLSTISEFDVDAAFADIIAKEWPNLEGRQTPRSLCFTEGDTELGVKAALLAFRAGRIRSMPWQSWSLDQIMAKSPDGTWTHPECCLIVPRQNGKSLILVIRVLYGLFKLGENIVFSAHQWETAKSLWKRTWAIVKTTPWLNKLVESHTCSQGRGTIELTTGAKVVFTTRSANAGRGLDKVDLVIYDEAYDLTEADMAALSPTKMAADDPQTIYTSSAVNQEQHPNGQVLAAVRERLLAGEEGLFGAEWMAPEELDRAEPSTWRWANPSFGVIQTVKKLAAEFKAMTTGAGRKSFDVEYLGRGDWPTEVTVKEPVIDPDLWGDMGQANPPVKGSIALGVDMTADQKWVTIAAATWTDDDRIRLEIGYHEAPSQDVVSTLLRLIYRWDPCVLVINGTSPAKSLVPELANAGIEPELTNSSQITEACASFYTAAVNHRLSHADDPRLTDALMGADKKEFAGGAWGWDYKSDVVLSPLQAATLAHWGLQAFGTSQVPDQNATQVETTREPAETGLMAVGF
ncbi:terminase large subunit [Gordonia phage MichaelScott]|uniref:Terminase large subunit n=2 Tax=Beenievirus TaxID=3044673 RepID=A0A2K9VGZ1_9CAUD|nr:terminase large subunit [Gordonia phage Beenie]YP_010654555.1 terminase large subunit [Gordonia phage MichaelScott]AUV61569.1 terminase large subunit [Gordonia phage Beenie]QOC56245.1 terminase large subunit [Gordonia phage MichaelScott]